MINTCRATWAATITTKARTPRQLIQIYYNRTGQIAEVDAALLDLAITDRDACAVILSETGEIVWTPESEIELLTNIDGDAALIITDADTGSAYTWTETNRTIRDCNDYDAAADALTRQGWTF